MPRQRGGLTDEQVEQLRTGLAAGRRPKVRLSGSQFGQDVTGTVTAVGDPAADGDDFVTVRVKAQGVTDDLRFAPGELALPGRGTATPRPRAARTPTAVPSTTAAEPQWTPAPVAPPAPAPRATAAKSVPRTPAAAPQAPLGVAEERARPSAPAKGGSRRGATPLPRVEVTVTSSGASWSVTARRGARVVVKSAAVQPGVVTAIAALLDSPAVTDAVAAVNEAALREAEARAEALRAELAELEAVLDSHRRP